MGDRLHILQHSLGVDEFGQGRQYRNHFCTGPGSLDYDACMACVADGLMTRRDGKNLPFGGNDMFYVTDAGRRWMAKNSPAPPKLTRSQARYRRYLAADSSHTFREWLDYDREPARVRVPTAAEIDATEVPF